MPHGFTLVVEDDRDEPDTILSALATLRLADDAVVAADGGDALSVLYGARGAVGRGLGCPALLVVNVDAPRVWELQLPVLVRTQPKTAALPIVTIVSSPADVCRAHDGRIVSDWFVRKPCSVLALGAAIEVAYARHLPRPETVRSHAAR